MVRLKRGRKTWIVAKTFVAAALIVLLVANLSLGDKRIEERVETLYTVADPQFRRTMDVMLGPALLGGNRAQALYWSGEIGAQFASALAERAKAGVKVHVLFDALGSGKIDDRAVEEMKAAGVEVQMYNPLRWNTLATINNRTHRKIMVVDGRIGYTGGVGIADEWRGIAQDPEHWRDTHFRLEGPAVAHMQAAFMENWIEVTGHVLHGEAGRRLGEHAPHVPAVDRRGGEVDPALRRLLRPRRSRNPHAGRGRAAGRARADHRSRPGNGLAGVEIYEYQPTFFHCKVMVVDDLWVSVGSTNFDSRSFSVNDEANLSAQSAFPTRIGRIAPGPKKCGSTPWDCSVRSFEQKGVFLRHRFRKTG